MLAQRLERLLAHATRGGAVADLVEVVGVREHERAASEIEDVELDQIDSGRDGRAKRAQRVLRGERRGPAVPDPDEPPLPPRELDHEAAGRVGTPADVLRRRRSHQPAASPTTIACATTMTAAIVAVSCQNSSG